MSTLAKLQLHIVSQEKELEHAEADQLTLPTATGEITVLPGHIPLMSRLTPGIMEYRVGPQRHQLVISNGFINVGPNNKITILVDTAVLARDASESKAHAAIEAAQHTMASSADRRELLMAEASLKLAMLELKLAQKTKKAQI